MKASDKITKAKVKLILNSPFFATLVLKMEYIEDSSILTAATNGKKIKYNPTFIDSLSLEETEGVLVHEVLHVALMHHTRRQNRDAEKWNIACDFPINEMTVASNFKLPAGGLMPTGKFSSFANKSAEEIFSLLPDMPNFPSGFGYVEDSEAKTQSEIQQIEAEVKQTLAQAATIAKQQGKLPAHLERLVEEMLAPKVPWKEVLQRFLCQIAHSDYTWTKPNKRFLHVPLYMPALESIETGEIVLMVDTSGSIDGEILSQFAAEIQEISSTFKTGFKVIYVDAEVAGVQDIEPDEPIVLKPAGGGGTCFIPGFKWLEKEGIEPCAVVYLTDGYCNTFPKDPNFPVLWAVYNNKGFQYPFGECVHI